jgi:16S rRNA A1518/A1519 N6-dimethyltransferase RsmA/KsgA/DIM1 with predicted DNA glycosylase/AP lyase activity
MVTFPKNGNPFSYLPIRLDHTVTIYISDVSKVAIGQHVEGQPYQFICNIPYYDIALYDKSAN